MQCNGVLYENFMALKVVMLLKVYFGAAFAD
jgi:hypothetical protein